MLALAQLYNAARCALLRLACRAARMAAEGAAGSGASGALGSEGPAEEARQQQQQQLEAWRQGLADLAAHYPCRGVVGQFVDQVRAGGPREEAKRLGAVFPPRPLRCVEWRSLGWAREVRGGGLGRRPRSVLESCVRPGHGNTQGG